MKIRITKSDSDEKLYELLIDVLSEKFNVINISREYENRSGKRGDLSFLFLYDVKLDVTSTHVHV